MSEGDAPVCVTCGPEESNNLGSQAPTTAPAPAPPPVPASEDVMDPSTFLPPILSSITPSVIIEYCDRCRWLHRATWTQTELYLTFPAPAIKSITLIGHNSADTGGRFRIWLTYAPAVDAVSTVLIWDRKTRGGFPELKEVKQIIRDHIQPGTSLGHSDKKDKKE
ncbi:hypothetical protein DL93DRAFT_2072078 [Clavulina sp. PMI_390]|nr:hypothetical protein DL93DRAFT_2072078 [Clavulina sp. PMI_390]